MTLFLLICSVAVYVWGVRAFRAHARTTAGLEWWRTAAFGTAIATLTFALLSPLDRQAALLLSSHITQHELLMLVAAPLLALGRPGLAMLWALPPAARLRAGRLIHAVRPLWRRATSPAAIFLLYASIVWMTHVPALFNLALAHDGVHALQHSLLLLSATLFWWALVEGRYGASGYGAAVVFVFATCLHTGLLGAGLAFAPRLLYRPYESPAAAIGVDPVQDQQLAGLIMWVPASALFIAFGLGLVAAWLGASERRARLNRTPGRFNALL